MESTSSQAFLETVLLSDGCKLPNQADFKPTLLSMYWPMPVPSLNALALPDSNLWRGVETTPLAVLDQKKPDRIRVKQELFLSQ